MFRVGIWCSMLAIAMGAAAQDEDMTVDPFIGDYATADYAKRGEGYDWVGVRIEKIHDRQAYVAVRARADLKRPTCTFDGTGLLVEPGKLVMDVTDKKIVVTLEGDTLTIKPENASDAGLLNYFCHGGASIDDTYIKLDEPLDEHQLPDDEFFMTLQLQGIVFEVTANTYRPFFTFVSVHPSGLELDNTHGVHFVKEAPTPTAAVIEDLNSDGWPEVVVVLTNEADNNSLEFMGYSVNNGKSMSLISMPDLASDPEYGVGYMGQEEFTLIETSLVRRFPLHDPQTGEPTGKLRQIQYKLVDGEASRRFEIVGATEFSAKKVKPAKG